MTRLPKNSDNTQGAIKAVKSFRGVIVDEATENVDRPMQDTHDWFADQWRLLRQKSDHVDEQWTCRRHSKGAEMKSMITATTALAGVLCISGCGVLSSAGLPFFGGKTIIHNQDQLAGLLESNGLEVNYDASDPENSDPTGSDQTVSDSQRFDPPECEQILADVDEKASGSLRDLQGSYAISNPDDAGESVTLISLDDIETARENMFAADTIPEQCRDIEITVDGAPDSEMRQKSESFEVDVNGADESIGARLTSTVDGDPAMVFEFVFARTGNNIVLVGAGEMPLLAESLGLGDSESGDGMKIDADRMTSQAELFIEAIKTSDLGPEYDADHGDEGGVSQAE